MRIEERAESLVIKTTDIHLPRRIAAGIHHAYKGKLDLHYDDEGSLLHAHWRRDE